MITSYNISESKFQNKSIDWVPVPVTDRQKDISVKGETKEEKEEEEPSH